jgi:hypothetical protein
MQNILKKTTTSNSKLKTWLRLNGFKPAGLTNWKTCMKYCVFRRNGKLYRFRLNQPDFVGWAVDISCPIDDFDRWSNSQDHHALTLFEFVHFYN